IRRFGFITTNSITQVFNRKVLQQHLDAADRLSIVFAVPDHPWEKGEDGAAAVRVAMTAAVAGVAHGTVARLESERETSDDAMDVALHVSRGNVHEDLTIGASASDAEALHANEGLSFMGVILVGQGFVVEPEDPLVSAELDALKTYLVGNELNQRPK